MKLVKDYSFAELHKIIFGKNTHFKSDCEFFPNFDVTIKVNDIYLRSNEIMIKGKTKSKKEIIIGSNMKNLQFELI